MPLALLPPLASVGIGHKYRGSRRSGHCAHKRRECFVWSICDGAGVFWMVAEWADKICGVGIEWRYFHAVLNSSAEVYLHVVRARAWGSSIFHSATLDDIYIGSPTHRGYCACHSRDLHGAYLDARKRRRGEGSYLDDWAVRAVPVGVNRTRLDPVVAVCGKSGKRDMVQGYQSIWRIAYSLRARARALGVCGHTRGRPICLPRDQRSRIGDIARFGVANNKRLSGLYGGRKQQQ